MAEACRSIARIQKTHGRKGEVVVVPTDGLPFVLHEGLEVALVPPALKGPRWRRVSACSGTLVRFSGVDSLGAASDLVGKTVLARTADLPRDLALHDAAAFVGRAVNDATFGLLGTICEVMVGPANDVWVVRGNHGEVLVPAVEPIVLSWDEGAPIEVDLPRGLVEEEGEDA